MMMLMLMFSLKEDIPLTVPSFCLKDLETLPPPFLFISFLGFVDGIVLAAL